MTQIKKNARAFFHPQSGIIIFLILLTISAYWGVHTYEYINLDDTEAIVKNPQVAGGLSVGSIAWAFTTQYCYGYWMPLSWISFMLDTRLFGLNPGASHIINLLFHCMNVLLLYIILKSLTGLQWRSAAVACIFAIHPVHVESVAWISERKDVLSAFFFFLTLLLYCRFIRKRKIHSFVFLAVSFILGLLTKPMLVTLPLVLLLIDFWPARRFTLDITAGSSLKNIRQSILEKLPLFALSIVFITINLAIAEPDKTSSFAVLSFTARLANALVSYSAYIGKLLYPVNLGIFYPHPFPDTVPLWKIAGACMALIGISTAAIKYIKRAPYLLIGWLWYLVGLTPAIGLAQTGSQAMADRFVYVPAIGIYVMVVWGAADLIRSAGRKANTVSALFISLCLIILFLLTRRQQAFWQSSIPIFEHTLAVTAKNHLIHNNLGAVLYENKRYDQAFMHYKKALEYNPGNEVAWDNLGVYYADRDSLRNAELCFLEAVRIRADCYTAIYNLGKTYERERRDSLAALYYRKYLSFNPDHVPSLKSLGLMCITQNNPDEALYYLTKALRLLPGSAEIHNSIGLAYQRKNDFKNAFGHFLTAVEKDPTAWQPFNNMGLMLLARNNLPYAIRSFTEAIRLSPDNERLFFNRGMAFISAGLNENAKSDFQTVVSINPQNIQAHVYLGEVFEKMREQDSAGYHRKLALQLKGK